MAVIMGSLERNIACQFKITEHDYAVMNQTRFFMPKKFNRIMIIKMIIFLVIAALIVWLLIKATGDPASEVLTAMALGAGFWAVMLWLFRVKFTRLYGWLMAKVAYRSFRVDKGEHHVKLSSDGFSASSNQYDVRLPWTTFHCIMRSEAHFILWLNPMQAHILPFRALTSDDVDDLWAYFETMPVSKLVKVAA